MIFNVFLVHPAAIGGLFPSHPQPIANSSLTQTKVILFNKFLNLFNKIVLFLSSFVIHALEALFRLNVYGVHLLIKLQYLSQFGLKYYVS